MGYDEQPIQQRYIKYYKMGDGALYVFYTPYHLYHLETPLTVARAVLFWDAVLASLDRPMRDVTTAAKRDLEEGETHDGLGGLACSDSLLCLVLNVRTYRGLWQVVWPMRATMVYADRKSPRAVVKMASSQWHFGLFQKLDVEFKAFRSCNDSGVTGPSAAGGVTSKRIMNSMLPCMIICIGVVLRFAQYMYNRSLWLDEVSLTLNIIDRSFSELVRPLDYAQGAPVGFLMLERLAVQAFGHSEYVLRLIPFLSGTIALPLFYKVAKLCIKPEAVPIALGLFALSDPLIYYSSEAKQYSSDVAIALLLCSVLAFDQSRRLTAPRIVFLGVLGAIAVWFSHPAAFILAGVGASLIASNLVKRR